MAEPSWTMVVPVKGLTAAKSRLRGAVVGVRHEGLALALALDTVDAALSCGAVREVVVVTGDPEATGALRRLGALVIPEPAGSGLNPAFSLGARLAAGRWVAALTADLPAMRPADLAAVLRLAAAGAPRARHFVADTPGTGTVLLTAPPGTPLEPRFGPASARAHAASGAHPLVGDWPALRRDVDTPADLADATSFGLGRHTAALLTRSPARS